MPTVEGYELDVSDREGFRVAIGHGTLDPIIPVDFGRQAAQRLRDAGADVLYRESPVRTPLIRARYRRSCNGSSGRWSLPTSDYQRAPVIASAAARSREQLQHRRGDVGEDPALAQLETRRR